MRRFGRGYTGVSLCGSDQPGLLFLNGSHTGYSLEDIELFEINEAFAAPSVALERELGLNPEIVNVNGGGIALGHPIGNTGCRLVVSLIHEMEKRNLNRGLAALCGGGGHGQAILLEKA